MPPKTKFIDVDAMKDLLLWARKERIALSQVQVGDVSLVVTMDHRIIRADEDHKPRESGRKSIIEEYGGALFAAPEAATEADTVETTVEDED